MSTESQLRSESLDGLTVPAGFEGRRPLFRLGPFLLRRVDRQAGLTGRLARALSGDRHPMPITHSTRDLIDPAEAGEQASGATLPRLENAASSKDAYRMAVYFVGQFFASYTERPQAARTYKELAYATGSFSPGSSSG